MKRQRHRPPLKLWPLQMPSRLVLWARFNPPQRLRVFLRKLPNGTRLPWTVSVSVSLKRCVLISILAAGKPCQKKGSSGALSQQPEDLQSFTYQFSRFSTIAWPHTAIPEANRQAAKSQAAPQSASYFTCNTAWSGTFSDESPT